MCCTGKAGLGAKYSALRLVRARRHGGKEQDQGAKRREGNRGQRGRQETRNLQNFQTPSLEVVCVLRRVLVCPSLEGSVEVVRNPADEGGVPSRCGQLLLLLLGVLSGRGWGVCIVCWRAGPRYLKKVSPRDLSTSISCVCLHLRTCAFAYPRVRVPWPTHVCLHLRTHPDADMNHDMCGFLNTACLHAHVGIRHG